MGFTISIIFCTLANIFSCVTLRKADIHSTVSVVVLRVDHYWIFYVIKSGFPRHKSLYFLFIQQSWFDNNFSCSNETVLRWRWTIEHLWERWTEISLIMIKYIPSAGWWEWDGWPPLARGAHSCHPASLGHPAPGHPLLLPVAVPGPPSVNVQTSLFPPIVGHPLFLPAPPLPLVPLHFSPQNFLLFPSSRDTAQTVKRPQRQPGSLTTRKGEEKLLQFLDALHLQHHP